MSNITSIDDAPSKTAKPGDGEKPEAMQNPEADTPPKPVAKKTAKKPAKKATKKPSGDVYAEPIPLDADIFQDDRLDIDVSEMSFEEWARLGENLQRMDRCHKWWLGDWWHLGEDKFGNEAWGAFNTDLYDETTISNYQWVSAAIPPKHRRPELSWSHHREVAGLPTITLKKKALKWAVDHPDESGRPASTRALAQYVKTLHPKEETSAPSTERKLDHTYRISFRLKEPEFEQGDAMLAALEREARRLEAEYGIELLGFETTPRTIAEAA